MKTKIKKEVEGDYMKERGNVVDSKGSWSKSHGLPFLCLVITVDRLIAATCCTITTCLL